jgi:hypothetical protein
VSKFVLILVALFMLGFVTAVIGGKGVLGNNAVFAVGVIVTITCFSLLIIIASVDILIRVFTGKRLDE